MAITSISPDGSTLARYLCKRPLCAVRSKQWLLHACRGLPQQVINPLSKTLWPRPLRHMRQMPTAALIRPGNADGCWTIRGRGGRGAIMRSRPLRELRNSIHKPAMLIATGPSANEFDWSTLKDGCRTIWAVNGAPILLEKHGLKCDFMVVTDHRFARIGADHIALAAKLGATLCFSGEAAAGFALTRPEVMASASFHVFEKAGAWLGVPEPPAAELERMNREAGSPFVLPGCIKPGVGWSHDPALGVFAGRTVAFAALQLVVWSGSRDIGVVGLDLGGGARAYAEAKMEVSHLERDLEGYIRPSFECMASALSGSSIRIINHSRTSPLARDLVPQSS